MNEPESRVSVDVVFPCLDERGALPWVLSRLPPGYRAIVVDNGSTDGSAAVAAAFGATVVAEPIRGFGSAAHAGLVAATADYVAFCDCDGSMDPAELPALLAPLLTNTADLVLGRRRPERRSWPVHARFANIVLACQLRRLTGERVSDLGPMRVARRADLLSLDLLDRRSGYPLEMFLKASQRHWRILELPIVYSPRTGRSKVTGTLRGTVTAVKDMSVQLKAARSLAAGKPVQNRRGAEEK
ncbi:glycosyltransferase [Paeniglutamicibacter antarcticus]|uniref:Glycosyltransferase n=1 Tax=Arthrobacter terrae TaxID=2935737 RepID=A0A931CNC2_9MICC|nr:glycosyltransferase [Arthrobacter terrae]MBG0740057.1 glycosyltransferase [Arthrobacter terrae]